MTESKIRSLRGLGGRGLASIRVRLLASFILVLILATIGSVVVVRAILVSRTDQRIDSELVQEAREVRRLSTGSDPDTGRPFGGRVRRIFEVFLERNIPARHEAQLTFVDGEPYLRSRAVVPYRLDQDPTLVERWGTISGTDRGRVDTPAGPVDYLAVPVRDERETKGVFVVAVFRDLWLEEINPAIAGAAGVGAIVVLIGSFLAWRLADRILGPVKKVTEAARGISESDLRGRIEVSGSDEIARLAQTFNEMLDRLEDAFTTQRRFIDDASHELRTPITVIQGQLDVLGDDPEDRRKALEIVMDELERMSRFVTDLLLLARADRPDFLSFDSVDVRMLSDEIFSKLNVLLGYTGQISLGHGAFLGIGAFASGLLTIQPRLPFLVGLAGAALAGALFALILGIPALRLRGLYLAITTIAFAFMMEESWFRWEALTGGSGGIELPRAQAGSFVFFEHADYLAVLLVILIGFWLLDQNITRTKLGRAFNAIRWDERVAQGFGVSVASYKILAFVISGALAAVSGALYGHLIGFINSESFAYKSQPNFSLLLVVIVAIGGLGSRAGVLSAGILFALIPRFVEFLEGWELIIGPIALIDVMARHPGGLAGAIRERREKRGEKKARAQLDTIEEQGLPKLPKLPHPVGLPERPDVLPGSALLEVQGVSVTFGGLKALSEVALTVPAGQIVGLIGPNGAGKTTLFNVISGFIKPDRGTAQFLGTELMERGPHARARLGIGRTFQQIGLTKDLSVEENFLLAQHIAADYSVVNALSYTAQADAVERSMRHRAQGAIKSLGFEAFSDTPVKNLSHGQQRLVELGCVLVTAPELLLLDEPSAGMAPAAVESLGERLREIRDELGRTILLIEHHIPLVLDVCDYIYVLNFGEVLAHGSTDEIAKNPEVMGAYFGEAVA